MILFDPAALTAPVAAVAEAERADSQSPAALVAVTSGALSVQLASGVSDLETQTPAQPGQTFENGSQSKMFTAVVVLQMVEKGLIGLDDRIADHLPDLTVGLPNGDTATIRQLLNMTSGIPNYSDVVGPDDIPLFIAALIENPGRTFGSADALAIARDMPPIGAPGEGFAYSNTNYTLLGQLIERISGQEYHAVVKDGVLDPAGMQDTVPLLKEDPARLSSYLIDPATGAPRDVSAAPWDLRGEAGFASTTTDMIAILQSLLVEKTLLSPASLAAMTDFFVTEEGPGFQSEFGLGLAAFTIGEGQTFVGFTGGSLGTASSTYLDLATGAIAATAGTIDTFDSVGASLKLALVLGETAAWAPVTDDVGPVEVASGAAAAMALSHDEDRLHYRLDGATLTLDRALSGVTTDTLRFADGSVVVVGDNAANGNAGDRAPNRIDILRDFAAAADADNALYGLGGSDRLAGGHGDDAIHGGAGNDRLFGRKGDDLLTGGKGADTLAGGDGDDTLVGGAGSDLLWGGAGTDRFEFDLGDAAAGRDTIGDFRSGEDLIVLRVDPAMADVTLSFIGGAAFGGTAGEIRYAQRHSGITLQIDVDGDGKANAFVHLRHAATISADDFLL